MSASLFIAILEKWALLVAKLRLIDDLCPGNDLLPRNCAANLWTSSNLYEINPDQSILKHKIWLVKGYKY